MEAHRNVHDEALLYAAEILAGIADVPRLTAIKEPDTFAAWLMGPVKTLRACKTSRSRRRSWSRKPKPSIFTVDTIIQYAHQPSGELLLLVGWAPVGRRTYAPTWIPRSNLLGNAFDAQIDELLASSAPTMLTFRGPRTRPILQAPAPEPRVVS